MDIRWTRIQKDDYKRLCDNRARFAEVDGLDKSIYEVFKISMTEWVVIRSLQIGEKPVWAFHKVTKHTYAGALTVAVQCATDGRPALVLSTPVQVYTTADIIASQVEVHRQYKGYELFLFKTGVVSIFFHTELVETISVGGMDKARETVNEYLDGK